MSLDYETYEEGIFKCLLSIAKSLAVIASVEQNTYMANHPKGRFPDQEDPNLKMSPGEEIDARVGHWREGDYLYTTEL